MIANIGGLPAGNSRRLALATAGFLAISYVAALGAVSLMPLSCRPWMRRHSSQLSCTPPAEMNFIELFIPANPFHALANNIVPAVVLFLHQRRCGDHDLLPNRQEIVGTLNLLTEALARVNSVLVKLTPFGVFAILSENGGDDGAGGVPASAGLPAHLHDRCPATRWYRAAHSSRESDALQLPPDPQRPACPV